MTRLRCLLPLLVLLAGARALAVPQPFLLEAEHHVIPPGLEQVALRMLGGSGEVSEGCRLHAASINRSRVRATFACGGEKLLLDLLHPDVAGLEERRTERFALRPGPSFRPELLDAVTALVSREESAWEWKTSPSRRVHFPWSPGFLPQASSPGLAEALADPASLQALVSSSEAARDDSALQTLAGLGLFLAAQTERSPLAWREQHAAAARLLEKAPRDAEPEPVLALAVALCRAGELMRARQVLESLPPAVGEQPLRFLARAELFQQDPADAVKNLEQFAAAMKRQPPQGWTAADVRRYLQAGKAQMGSGERRSLPSHLLGAYRRLSAERRMLVLASLVLLGGLLAWRRPPLGRNGPR